MEVRKEQFAETQTKSRDVVVYTKQDVYNLVMNDLRNRGMVARNIKASTEYKYVTDNWGMNASLVTDFTGVTVEIET